MVDMITIHLHEQLMGLKKGEYLEVWSLFHGGLVGRARGMRGLSTPGPWHLFLVIRSGLPLVSPGAPLRVSSSLLFTPCLMFPIRRCPSGGGSGRRRFVRGFHQPALPPLLFCTSGEGVRLGAPTTPPSSPASSPYMRLQTFPLVLTQCCIYNSSPSAAAVLP